MIDDIKSSFEKEKNSISKARLLMCAPDFFEVTYEINKWMQPQAWSDNSSPLKRQAIKEWQFLCKTFQSLDIAIDLIPPQPGVPDLVFTANAAIVLDGRVLLANFRHKERQPEEKYFAAHFQLMKEAGMVEAVEKFPAGILQEGAGDCIWDSKRQLFWAGYGPRSSKEAVKHVQDYYGKEVVPLELLSSRFYHLDLSLNALSSGEILYYPEAFSERSQKSISERVPADQLIALDQNDAFGFVCNLVNIENKIILSHCSDKLKNRLQEKGYTVISSPVDAFALAGGSVCCLTLKTNLRSSAKQSI